MNTDKDAVHFLEFTHKKSHLIVLYMSSLIPIHDQEEIDDGWITHLTRCSCGLAYCLFN